MHRQQVFKVVDNLNNVILLGRNFLSKFESLEIYWKKMTLKIDGQLIKGDKVIQGGELETRICVAKGETIEDSIASQLEKHVEENQYLSKAEKKSLLSLLLKHSDLFIQNPKKPPQARLVSHVIDTGNAQPVKSKMRRLPPKWIAEIETQVQEMLDNGICRPSNSPWSSQVLLVKKKDQSMRFVIDYRKLNDCTVRDEYPMPNIKDLMEEVAGSNFFSCMDLPSAYWHVPVEESSIEKTAFEIPKGKFEMLRMPFGLKNSQSTQQRLMDNTLRNVPNTDAYVDNILTHSVMFNDHLSHLGKCLTELGINNLSLRLDKCDFAKPKVEQFGFVISPYGFKPSYENVKKIQDYPRPKCSKEVRQFLGLANYYREFVKMFSDEAEPLQELLRKGNLFVWTENRERAFCSIKEKISTDCLLNTPNWNLPFTIEVDGSKIAVGATLTQQDNAGNQKVLSYHSSTMDPSQRNYSPTEQECWAAISACRKFDVYIKGAPSLTLISDHEPLQWLRKQKDPRNKFSRWIMELEQYPYEFKYRPGVEHQGPDTLSRIDTGTPSKTDDETKFEGHVYMVEMKDIKEPDEWKKLLVAEQIRDNAINIAREQLLDRGKIAIGRFKSFNKLYIQDGLLVKAGRIVVPNSLKYQIVRDFHSSNHWGAANTLNDVKKSYYWPNMQKYIEEYCASCEGCLRSKHMNVKSKAPLKPINWAQYHPRQAIALDLATMAPSSEGYRYIMLIVDGMSKFVELCPLRNINAKSVTKNVKREWIGRHGPLKHY